MNKLLYFMGLYVRIGQNGNFIYINKVTGSFIIPKGVVGDDGGKITKNEVKEAFDKIWN